MYLGTYTYIRCIYTLDDQFSMYLTTLCFTQLQIADGVYLCVKHLGYWWLDIRDWVKVSLQEQHQFCGVSMSFPVTHSHALARGPASQVRRKPTAALQSSCSSQRSFTAQHKLNIWSSLRGQDLGCRQLPSRPGKIVLHAVARQAGGDNRREEASDGFQERVVQVRRVTKVVKGGKQLSFR